MSTAGQTAPGEAQEKLAAIQAAARDVLRNEWSTAAFRALENSELGYSAALWDRIRSLGWPGIAIAEEHGGSGGTFLELCGLAEELGRANAPTPLLPTLTAAQAISLAGNQEVAARVLPRVATGEVMLALADLEPGLSAGEPAVNLAARREGAGYRLAGTKLFVPYGEHAAFLVTSARLADGDGLALFLVDGQAAGLTRRRLRPLDWSPLAEVVYEDVYVPGEDLLATGGAAADLLHEVRLRSALVTCSELLGVAETAHEMAVEYAKERVAFGRPIGSFQAIKHRLVNLRVNIEVARVLVHGAAEEMSAGVPERDAAGARAVFWCLDTLRGVPEGAHQVFGGIGITWDHDLHLFTRRAATLAALLGDRAGYRERVIADLDQRYR